MGSHICAWASVGIGHFLCQVRMVMLEQRVKDGWWGNAREVRQRAFSSGLCSSLLSPSEVFFSLNRYQKYPDFSFFLLPWLKHSWQSLYISPIISYHFKDNQALSLGGSLGKTRERLLVCFFRWLRHSWLWKESLLLFQTSWEQKVRRIPVLQWNRVDSCWVESFKS